jgi:hypothetical protein
MSEYLLNGQPGRLILLMLYGVTLGSIAEPMWVAWATRLDCKKIARREKWILRSDLFKLLLCCWLYYLQLLQITVITVIQNWYRWLTINIANFWSFSYTISDVNYCHLQTCIITASLGFKDPAQISPSLLSIENRINNYQFLSFNPWNSHQIDRWDISIFC